MNKNEKEFLKQRATYCTIHNIWYSNELSECPMCKTNMIPISNKRDAKIIRKQYIEKTTYKPTQCCMCGSKILSTTKYRKDNGSFCKDCLELIDKEIEWRQLYNHINRLNGAIDKGIVNETTYEILNKQIKRKEYLEKILLNKHNMTVDILIKNNKEALEFKEQLK